MNAKDQIIYKTSKIMIRHLMEHCNCIEEKPSDHADSSIAFQVMRNLISETPSLTIDSEYQLEQLYISAKELADSKWDSVMILLGL